MEGGPAYVVKLRRLKFLKYYLCPSSMLKVDQGLRLWFPFVHETQNLPSHIRLHLYHGGISSKFISSG